jgi:hypothetical protein
MFDIVPESLPRRLAWAKVRELGFRMWAVARGCRWRVALFASLPEEN